MYRNDTRAYNRIKLEKWFDVKIDSRNNSDALLRSPFLSASFNCTLSARSQRRQ